MQLFNTLCLALALLVLSVVPAAAQDAGADNPAADRLRRSMDFVSSLPAFTADVAMAFEIGTSDGHSNNTALKGRLALAGEDRARFLVRVEEGQMELFYAPDSVYIYLPAENQYVDGSGLGDRQQALTLLPGREYRPGQILLSDYLHDDDSLIQNADTITVVEAADADAGSAEQIRVVGEGIAADFWIRSGDQPVLEKFSMDITGMLAAREADISRAVITYTFSDWNMDPKLPEGHFAFSKPEGAMEFQGPNTSPPADPLQGQPAPDLTLDLLGGGQLDLAAHRGKDIVILDFWASWCRPCRIGLPIVSKVTAQFEDQNVVLYAVNIREDQDTARAFLDETGLDLTVAMDPEGVAQGKYQASSIPKTIIIDKDGTIHEVHTGVAPNMESVLIETLRELVD